MIALEEKRDVLPICPHCNQQLPKVWFRELKGVWGKRSIYFCPSCQKTLGISHRKGFFMG